MKLILALLAGLLASPAFAGSLALMGAGPSSPGAAAGCTESAAFLARVTAQDATHTLAYQNLICGLVTDGIWTKLDAVYMTKANEAATALTNLKSSSFGASAISAPTFAANAGYTGNGSSSYIDTSFNPSTAGGNWTQNSATIAVWVGANAQYTGGAVGQSSATGASYIYPRYTDNLAYVRINQSTDSTVASTDSSGFFVLSRTGASAVRFERNGSLLSTFSVASATVSSASMSILFGGNYFSGQVRAAIFGGGLTQTEMGNLYTRVNTYMGAF